jgi:hypothetical protein
MSKQRIGTLRDSGRTEAVVYRNDADTVGHAIRWNHSLFEWRYKHNGHYCDLSDYKYWD